MRNLKRALILSCAALMAGLITFTACKKKKPQPTKAKKQQKKYVPA